ncbi:hypothetical protein M2189_003565 [Bradyrhizobium japonicum]|uniref:hypothetical protein n=1 Tax=Bradyrhizobium japonicum TaxID=375 RepID=UPI00216A6296|nr:hypothetical protein [Bradyrhizobium japonicum]MCS3497476.1 hypothetical protein [Bradyrhizobium japonicum]MCS3960362.1 hypothetical protein [Bradyrhizobium japonicum]MCS4002116.1 hypothetical protein [Bradyrhizobium japonicum]
MPVASAYILKVPANRRSTILHRADELGYFPKAAVGEPVPTFTHSRNAPLVVLASFEDEAISHVASGRKGVSAGTGLVRLNMEGLHALSRPIPFAELKGALPPKFRAHFQRTLDHGGVLPPKTLGAVVDALIGLDASVGPMLARFSERRAEALRRLAPAARENLAIQKETLGVALEIAGISRDELLTWAPPDGTPHSFLEGLPQVYVREDAMLIADFSNLPGFRAISEASHYAARTFQNESDSAVRLTVLMANRLRLEEQTGADLVYYNETYRSFVMVQYKAMEKADETHEFRWQDNDTFIDEIARMDVLLAELVKIPLNTEPDGFRLSSNPFFLKFCPRIVFNPDDKGLFKGIYLPLDLWKLLHASKRLKGPKGGNVLSYENVGRRLNNTEFVTLVAGSWVGTTIGQSAALEGVIRSILQSGKTVTFAVKRKVTGAEASGAT